MVWVERRRKSRGSWLGRTSSGRGRELRDRVRVRVSVVWGRSDRGDIVKSVVVGGTDEEDF